MGLLSCGLQGRASSEINQKGEKTFSETWRVVCDTLMTPAEVRAAFSIYTGIVRLAIYAGDSKAVCTSIRAGTDSEDGYNHSVEVTYGPRESQEDCPWLQPASIKWSFDKTQVAVEKDIDGEIIKNSAGQFFSPPLTRLIVIPRLFVQQAELYFLPATAYAYINKINSNYFYGCEAETMKCENIGGDRAWDQEWGYYWNTSYEFSIKFTEEKWESWLIDKGTMEIKDGKLIDILINGARTTTPQLLDGSGAVPRKTDGSIDYEAEPYWMKFKLCEKLPFNFVFRS